MMGGGWHLRVLGVVAGIAMAARCGDFESSELRDELVAWAESELDDWVDWSSEVESDDQERRTICYSCQVLGFLGGVEHKAVLGLVAELFSYDDNIVAAATAASESLKEDK